MKSSTLIVWLLIAACIAIDLAMIAELQVRRNEWPGAGGVVGLGLSFSQTALLALWAVLGRSNILIRGVSTLLGVWAVSCLASYSSTGGRVEGVWYGVLLLYCGLSLFPFVIARFANYAFANKHFEKLPSAASRLPSNQFTIWGLLSLMTAVGITLAVARFAEFPMQDLAEVAAFFSLLAATVSTIFLLALSLSKVRNAIMLAIVICPIVGVLLSLTGLAPGEGPLELTLMMCVQGVASLSAAVVLRTAGYRLVRHNEFGNVTASGSSVASESVSEARSAEL